MADVSGASNVGYSYGVQQSFKQKIAYMAADEGFGDVSIFMNAMDKGQMQTTMDDLLNEAGGALPSNYECKSFAEKLVDFVKTMFNQKQNKTFDEPLSNNNEDITEKTSVEIDFSFDTQTEA